MIKLEHSSKFKFRSIVDERVYGTTGNVLVRSVLSISLTVTILA